MLSAFGGHLDFAAEARKNIKKREYIAQPVYMDAFAKKFIETGKVTSISVLAEARLLTAHKLVLPAELNVAPMAKVAKKAIILFPSNMHYVADSLYLLEPLLASLMKAAKKSGKNIEYAAYCQDYRGRGYNKNEMPAGKPEENWNDYTALQDAKDQEALIRKLVIDGYKPEDILLVGQSYGANVSLWAMHRLGPDYAKIKLFSDRAIGDPFESSLAKTFVADKVVAMKKLCDGEMHPPVSFHDIANNLPNILMTKAESDLIITPEMSLVHTFKGGEKAGQLLALKAENATDNSHNEKMDSFGLDAISDIRPIHLIASLLNEAPIKLMTKFKLLTKDDRKIEGFQLKKNATREQANDFVEFPVTQLEFAAGADVAESSLDVVCVRNLIAPCLVARLLDYCDKEADDAVKSESGGAYKKGILGKRWTAKEKVQTAVDMIVNFCKSSGPNVEYFNKLKMTDGPHKAESGDLYKIYVEVVKYVDEYAHVQQLNAYLASIKPPVLKPVDVKSQPSLSGLFAFDKRVIASVAPAPVVPVCLSLASLD